jgi:flavin reductase (DIM6/NTAB) family NADH-FMN oxidoreductase RutF
MTDASTPAPAAVPLDAATMPAAEAYRLLAGLVVPRPIAWVSTRSAAGMVNLAPHSFFNAVADDPPHIVFSIGHDSDTLRNLRHDPGFVVGLVSCALAEQMELTAVDFGPAESELAWAGLTPAPSRFVAAPRVAEAKASLECRCTAIHALGGNHLVIGEVLAFHVAPEVLRDGRVDLHALDPLCRLGGAYASLGPVFKLHRPSRAELEGLTPTEALARVRRRGID